VERPGVERVKNLTPGPTARPQNRAHGGQNASLEQWLFPSQFNAQA
jgi:hypothetical protein